MIKKDFINQLHKTMTSNGHTQKDVEKALKIDQSQVSRILSGDFVYNSSAVRELCKYANYNDDISSDVCNSKLLRDAILEVWDGSKKKEKQIARIIKDIGKLL